MKFRLVEDIVTESDLTDKNLIKELKEKFGDDFDSKPLCKEVTEYISKKFSIKGLYNNIIVFSKESGIISRNGHCVIFHNNRIYDYTANQYAIYPGIEKDTCPKILTYDKTFSELMGMKAFSKDNYIICISEHV